MITLDKNHIYRNEAGEVYLSVTQHLTIAGLVDYSMVKPEDLAYATERGKYVHEAIHLYLYDDLDIDSLDEAYKGYVEAAIKFFQQTGVEVLSAEEIVYNDLLRTAGQYDFICPMESKLNSQLFEIKTTSTIPVTAKLQTAAYRQFFNNGCPDGTIPIIDRHCLHLKPTGNYKVITYPRNRSDEIAFNNICRANWWALSNKIIPIGAKADPKVYELCEEIIG